MANQLYLDMQQKALEACFALHKQLLTDDAAWGYDGTKDDFDRLFAEVYIIARDEVPDEADIEQVIETFWDYQMEQMNGVREIGWYL